VKSRYGLNGRIKFKQPVRGFNVGGCVTGGPLPEDQIAHAHLAGSSPKWAQGFICAVSHPALIHALLHELAHLIANTGHDDRWRREMRRLGVRVPAEHRKKPKT
jgi:hypothetical protein